MTLSLSQWGVPARLHLGLNRVTFQYPFLELFFRPHFRCQVVPKLAQAGKSAAWAQTLWGLSKKNDSAFEIVILASVYCIFDFLSI